MDFAGPLASQASAHCALGSVCLIFLCCRRSLWHRSASFPGRDFPEEHASGLSQLSQMLASFLTYFQVRPHPCLSTVQHCLLAFTTLSASFSCLHASANSRTAQTKRVWGWRLRSELKSYWAEPQSQCYRAVSRYRWWFPPCPFLAPYVPCCTAPLSAACVSSFALLEDGFPFPSVSTSSPPAVLYFTKVLSFCMISTILLF